MIAAEHKLLNMYIKNDFDCLEEIFEKFFSQLIEDHRSGDRKVRHMKNHLISINSCIYSILYGKPMCKTNLYKTRKIFTQQVEEAQDLKDLRSIANKMIHYYSNIDRIQAKSCTHPAIRDAVEYIDKNLDKNLSLRKVANEVHVSKNYLSFLFSEYMGASFSDYINKLRIEKAKVLLEDSTKSILDIALECGFTSQSYFCSVFKKFEYISPKKYQYSLEKKPS